MNLNSIIDELNSNTSKPKPSKEVLKRIKFLRLYLSIHSYIYYHLGDSIIEDSEWDKKAIELSELQKQYGYILKIDYDREFYEFTGATGMHLPKDDYIKWKALQLVRICDNIKLENINL